MFCCFYLRISLFYFHSWRVFFLDIEFWVDSGTYFSFSTFKSPLGLYCFWQEVSLNSYCQFPVCDILLISSCSQHFLLVCVLRSLTMMFMDVVFFVFIHAVFHWASWICRCVFFTRFWKIWSLLFQIFFPILFPLPSTFGTRISHALNFLVLSHRSLRICSCFSIFVSLFFRMNNFCWLVFKLTDSSLCHLYSTKPNQWTFILDILFFISKISIWFFLYSFYFSAEITYSFIKSLFSFMSLSIVLIVILNSMSAHFNMWGIFGFIFIDFIFSWV